jgi:hypothetical protein
VQDRQKTLKEIQTFLDTKIAPKEIIDELKVFFLVPFSSGHSQPHPVHEILYITRLTSVVVVISSMCECQGV